MLKKFIFLVVLTAIPFASCSDDKQSLSMLTIKTIEIENDPHGFISAAIAEKLYARGARSDENGVTLKGTAVYTEKEKDEFGKHWTSLEISVQSQKDGWAAHSSQRMYLQSHTYAYMTIRETLAEYAAVDITQSLVAIASSRTKKG